MCLIGTIEDKTADFRKALGFDEIALEFEDAGFRHASLRRASEIAAERHSVGPGARLANVIEATI